MSSIPLVALAVHPPDIAQNAAGSMQLRQLAGQNAMIPGQLQQQQQQLQGGQQQLQLGKQAIQQGEYANQDREAGMKAMQQWSGKDLNELPDLIQKNGGSLQAVLGAKKSAIEAQQQVMNLNTSQLTQAKTKNDYLLGKLQAATDKSIPDDQLPQSVMAATQQAIKDGFLDPPHAQEVQQLIQQFPDPTELRNHLSIYEKGLMSQTEQFSQETKNRETAAQEQQAAARASQADTAAQKLKDEQPGGSLYKDPNKPSGTGAGGSADDIAAVVQGIKEGKATPILSNYSFRDRTAIEAGLQRAGVNQSEAEQDFRGVQRHLSALNGPQQLRIRQATQMVGDTLPQLQSAYDKWAALAPQSGFKVLNKASLASMKQLPGAAGDAATQLDAAIADFTPELATMYQGGNTPGDKALELAGHNISGDWNDQTFRDALTRIGKARDTRARTLDAIGTSGMSQNSKYDQGRQGGAQGGGQSQSGATSQHIPGGKAAGLTEGATGTGSDGKKYIVKGGVWQPATQ